MPIVLYRVDDRLVHGQVILGWGQALGVDFIALVDDEVRRNESEQELYRTAVPPEIEIMFNSVAEATANLRGWLADGRRGIVLTGDVASMAELVRKTELIPTVNLGGIHARPGRVERRPYVYLSDEEMATLRELEETGIKVTAQDVPTAAPIPLKALA